MPRKGQDTLIRALPIVHRRRPDAALLMVGDGPYERRLRDLTAKEHVEDSVVFAGGHPHASMPLFCHCRGPSSDATERPTADPRNGAQGESLGAGRVDLGTHVHTARLRP
ncbi:glycosyltransferase [Streptomyces sp. URMC 126]|uniref:glycosyltransferase n=1 Tax=Streptomyces sp. URMC 126 TaxID=3423401 RepID=UPI003F1B5F4F